MRSTRAQRGLMSRRELIAAGLLAATAAGLDACSLGRKYGPAPYSRATRPSGPLSSLRAAGTELVDASGRNVYLNGVNLGGWLEWEGWIFGGGYDSESDILNHLGTLTSQASAEAFQRQVWANMVQEADIAQIAEFGFNAVRVPFNHRIFDTWEQDGPAAAQVDLSRPGWQIFDDLVTWCERQAVYIVPDMHAAPGAQADGFPMDPVSHVPLLWDSGSSRALTVEIWRAFADRYRDSPAIAGYDLLNEPWPTPDDSALLELYRECITAIRSVDPTHMIVLEGARAAHDFTWVAEPLDANLALSAHVYLWSTLTPRLTVSRYNGVAKRWNVPLLIGEYGVDATSRDAKAASIFDSQPTIRGRLFWTWKGAYLDPVKVRVPSSWKPVIDLSNGSPPTGETAQAGMDAFAQALLLTNCELDSGLAGALV